MENKVHWLEPVDLRLTSPKQAIQLSSQEHVSVTLHTPLHDAILTLKNDIDRITPVGYWDDAKKITNPYEYIFLSLQRRMHRSIAANQPLSRSYFKMLELWDLLGLSAKVTAHSAEGPGGFLEAIQDRKGHKVPMVAMTLKSTERTVPGWRKSQAFMANHPMVHITYGWDGTGNLYSLLNQQSFESTCRAHLGPEGADLYTADGGFDFSADFNGQENTVQRLLVAEVLAGVRTLKIGGTMILKLFDTKQQSTLELMWLMSLCFERTGLVKPNTSRPANSERYWIGQGFRTPPVWLVDLLMFLTRTDAPNGWNQLFEVPPYNAGWLTGIQAFQEELETHQFDKIQLTLNLIRNPVKSTIATLLLENISNSRRWCVAHTIPMNRAYEGLSDEQIASLNLEEALEPFQAAGVHRSLPAPSPPSPMPHALTGLPSPRPPAVSVWRSALPLSILGRSASQTVSDSPAPAPSVLLQSPPS